MIVDTVALLEVPCPMGAPTLSIGCYTLVTPGLSSYNLAYLLWNSSNVIVDSTRVRTISFHQ